jgi:hypothetical protein
VCASGFSVTDGAVIDSVHDYSLPNTLVCGFSICLLICLPAAAVRGIVPQLTADCGMAGYVCCTRFCCWLLLLQLLLVLLLLMPTVQPFLPFGLLLCRCLPRSRALMLTSPFLCIHPLFSDCEHATRIRVCSLSLSLSFTLSLSGRA